MADSAKAAHDALVEVIAEGKDELMEEFFEKGTLPEEHMIEALREATAKDKLFPILCGSASCNIGTDLLLNFLVEYFPSAIQHDPVHATAGDQRVDRTIADTEPQSAFVFKTMADPFAGRVTYFKVYSGVLKEDDHLFNMRTSSDERLAHIGVPMGKQIVPVRNCTRVISAWWLSFETR
jgi:elongation factor G